MRYSVRINRRFQYIKVVKVIKKVHDNTNRLSKLVADLINRYTQRKGQ